MLEEKATGHDGGGGTWDGRKVELTRVVCGWAQRRWWRAVVSRDGALEPGVQALPLPCPVTVPLPL